MADRDVRERDILVAPNEYAYVQDLTKGDIVLYVGPTKISLSNTERMITLRDGRFVPVRGDEGRPRGPPVDLGDLESVRDPREPDRGSERQPDQGRQLGGDAAVRPQDRRARPRPVSPVARPARPGHRRPRAAPGRVPDRPGLRRGRVGRRAEPGDRNRAGDPRVREQLLHPQDRPRGRPRQPRSLRPLGDPARAPPRSPPPGDRRLRGPGRLRRADPAGQLPRRRRALRPRSRGLLLPDLQPRGGRPGRANPAGREGGHLRPPVRLGRDRDGPRTGQLPRRPADRGGHRPRSRRRRPRALRPGRRPRADPGDLDLRAALDRGAGHRQEQARGGDRPGDPHPRLRRRARSGSPCRPAGPRPTTPC